jgi:hypothetical protein
VSIVTGPDRSRQTFSPRSSSVRSSTLAAMTFHLASTSAKNPRNAGLAAVNASWMSALSPMYLQRWEAGTYHDRCYWDQGIIDPSCLVHVPCLESDLKTATSHSECHGVHLDVRSRRSWFRGNFSSGLVFLLPTSCHCDPPICPLLSGAEVPDGKTVFLSTNIGTLISTKLPLLSLMFAVKVLYISISP